MRGRPCKCSVGVRRKVANLVRKYGLSEAVRQINEFPWTSGLGGINLSMPTVAKYAAEFGTSCCRVAKAKKVKKAKAKVEMGHLTAVVGYLKGSDVEGFLSMLDSFESLDQLRRTAETLGEVADLLKAA